MNETGVSPVEVRWNCWKLYQMYIGTYKLFFKPVEGQFDRTGQAQNILLILLREERKNRFPTPR